MGTLLHYSNEVYTCTKYRLCSQKLRWSSSAYSWGGPWRARWRRARGCHGSATQGSGTELSLKEERGKGFETRYIHVYIYTFLHSVPPKAAHFSKEKWLPWVCCVALPCLFVWPCLLLSSFPLISHLKMYMYIRTPYLIVHMQAHVHLCICSREWILQLISCSPVSGWQCLLYQSDCRAHFLPASTCIIICKCSHFFHFHRLMYQ